MTAPALAWLPYDAELSHGAHPGACSYPYCGGEAVLMRGPRDARLRPHIRWRAFCRAHASMYGATLRGSRLVTTARMG